MRFKLYIVTVASFLAWIAVAELLQGNIWLGTITTAAAAFVVAAPKLFRVAEPSPQAPSDTAPPSDPVPFAGARGVAPAATRREC